MTQFEWKFTQFNFIQLKQLDCVGFHTIRVELAAMHLPAEYALLQAHILQAIYLQNTLMNDAFVKQGILTHAAYVTTRGGGLGSRPKKMYGNRLGDGVEYHLMSPTPRR